MTNVVQWRRPSMLSLQRDIADTFEEFEVPRSIRREMERLFADVSSPRSLWSEMDRLLEDFDSPPGLETRIARLFEAVIGDGRHTGSQGKEMFTPSLDLIEQENEYVLKADLPGMREQDIDIRVSDDNTLTLSGERRQEDRKQGRGYEYTERTYGSFSRSVSLPTWVDAAKIQADFRDGVLEVHVPKTEATSARRIPLSRREEPRVMESGNGPSQQNRQNGQGPQQQTQQPPQNRSS